MRKIGELGGREELNEKCKRGILSNTNDLKQCQCQFFKFVQPSDECLLTAGLSQQEVLGSDEEAAPKHV